MVHDPFRYLKVTFQLRSPTIYDEAMKPASAIHMLDDSHRSLLYRNDPYNRRFLIDLGCPDLQNRLEKATVDKKQEILDSANRVLTISKTIPRDIRLEHDVANAASHNWILDYNLMSFAKPTESTL